jgi:hypothetical protein
MKTIKIELTQDELSCLINDTTFYVWKIENTTKVEDLAARNRYRGYYTRKNLLEKLMVIEQNISKTRKDAV